MKSKPSYLFRGLTAVLALLMLLCTSLTTLTLGNTTWINSNLNIQDTKTVGGTGEYAVYWANDYGYDNTALIQVYHDAAEANKEIAAEGITLLKNADSALPLAKDSKITLFGNATVNSSIYKTDCPDDDPYVDFVSAMKSEFGDSNINTTLCDNVYQGMNSTGTSSVAEAGIADVKKYESSWQSDYNDAAVVVFARNGSEGNDVYQYAADDTYSDGSARRMMDLSTNEQALIEYLSAQKKAGVFKSIVVIIASEFQMELGFLDEYDIDACLLTGMTGSYGCEAIAQVLDGTVNPSGRTVDTYASNSLSAPSVVNGGVEGVSTWGNAVELNDYDKINGDENIDYYIVYGEGIYVGYKYYETRYEDTVMNAGNANGTAGTFNSSNGWNYAEEMCYPFGYGLSYTTFAYSDLKADADKVTFTITNTGSRAGAEIAQLYVAKADAAVFRPEKELKGFAKVFLQAGECKTVTIPLDDKAFRYWNVKTDRWETEDGSYQLLVGASVQDIRLRAEVSVQGTGAPDPYVGKAVQCYRTADIKNVPDAAFEALLGHAIPEDKPHIDQTMTLGELNHSRSPLCWLAWAVLHTLLKRSSREGTPDLNLLFQYNMPVRALAQMTGGMVGQETVDGIVMEAKGFWIIGLLRALIGFGQNAVSNRKFRAALDAERGGPAV